MSSAAYATPLPPGWSEHRAPSGYIYYYDTYTKTSTYTRPIAGPPLPPPPALPPTSTGLFDLSSHNASAPRPLQHYLPSPHPLLPTRPSFPGQPGPPTRPRAGRGDALPLQKRLQDKPDRPRQKRSIPGAEPWVLVTTKMGRKFVHNTDTKVSLWSALEDVQKAIEVFPEEPPRMKRPKRSRIEKERAARLARMQQRERVALIPAKEGGNPHSMATEPTKEQGLAEAGDEEEEDEVESGSEEPDTKHARIEARPQQTEFTEDDVAFQLAAMADEYGLGEEDLDESGENALTEEESQALFLEMLTEHNVNPFSTWNAEMPRFVEDSRYTLVSSTRARKELFTAWCRDTIARLKAEKAREKKVDPRIVFWSFLKENASAKLYWAEFKRKWKKASEMRDSKLVDRDREKMYREYITRVKSSDTVRENDLKKLLKTTSSLTRDTTLDALPDSILCDVRYVTAPEARRDAIITGYLVSLPETPLSEQEQRERATEAALRVRECAVRREQSIYSREEARARELLREEEAAIERATRVGKRGLAGHIIRKEVDTGEETTRDEKTMEGTGGDAA